MRPAPPCYNCRVPRSIVPAALILAAFGAASSVSRDPAGARALVDRATGEMFIDLAPVDLPAHASHHEVAQPPVAILPLPAAGFLYGFRVAVVDSAGRELPSQLIHHFNAKPPFWHHIAKRAQFPLAEKVILVRRQRRRKTGR